MNMDKNSLNHQKENNSLLSKGKFSAIEIAKCLLSFDSSRQYFTKNLVPFRDLGSIPMKGNFRLNKMLHMCQIFYCLKHKKPLFKEPMTAFEHGAVVHDVYSDFLNLYELLDTTTNLDKETYNFVHSIFKYFYQYKDEDAILREFSHEDPAWKLGREQEKSKRGGIMPLTEELISYYSDFFDDTLKEIEGN